MSKKRRRSKADRERERLATLAQLQALLKNLPVDPAQMKFASTPEEKEQRRQEFLKHQAEHGLTGEVVVRKVPIVIELPDGTREIELREVEFFRLR